MIAEVWLENDLNSSITLYANFVFMLRVICQALHVEQIHDFYNAVLRGLFERAIFAREFRSGIEKIMNRV